VVVVVGLVVVVVVVVGGGVGVVIVVEMIALLLMAIGKFTLAEPPIVPVFVNVDELEPLVPVAIFVL
jgi:hypothetical protein